MKGHNILFTALRLTLFLIAAACFLTASPLPPYAYSSSSRLASGRWAKVKVERDGMQLISVATLRKLGFSDPDKVRVYGYGGAMLPERLDGSIPDDLPRLKSLRTASGIVFLGRSSTSWATAGKGHLEYAHTVNPYSDASYYFISDIDTDDNSENGHGEDPESHTVSTDGNEIITSFTQRLVHEKELIVPANSGRLLLGEDFRTRESRTFRFDLPGNIGDARLLIAFGAKITNGQSAILVEANGAQLPATTADVIPGISSSEIFLNTISSPKTVENPGESLDLKITYTYSGAIFTAALDYIRVEYPRALRLHEGELYFQTRTDNAASVEVEGCTASTVIWDVTSTADIKTVRHILDGTTAIFATDAGYHEYVAFDPEKITHATLPAGSVANQDLHSLPAPDMLIVAPAPFRGAADRIASLHRDLDGMDVAIVLPEQVYNEFSSGNPDVTAFRRLLKMWHDKGKTVPYCLIMSRPTYDNKGVTASQKGYDNVRVPIWQSAEGFSESSSYSTDDYIGMLDDNPGIFDPATEKIHVAVGRMPVLTPAEAESAVLKLERYLKTPELGMWRNEVMVIADDQDNGIHLDQAEAAITAMGSTSRGSDRKYERLYLDSYPLSLSGTGATYPGARKRMFDKINDGVALISYIGHANPREWGHEKLLTWSDIENMQNRRLPFIFAATCEFLRWDDEAVSGGEKMWLRPYTGIIGMLCPSRKSYISLNGDLSLHISRNMFATDAGGSPLRIGDVMKAGKNDMGRDDNKLRYALMGDPALRLPSPALRVVTDTVAGIPTDSPDSVPVLKARQKVIVSGRVTDRDGNTDHDFNGILHLQLYDAETVVETLGNGENGKVSVYNDRKTRLAMARAEVTGGKWSCPVALPMEVADNYTPALLSMYASATDGAEANGAFTGFYVYGFDEGSPGDTDGPEFRVIYLNSPSFADGGEVDPSPVLYAELTDSSGINVSDSGIGHRMTLTIDDTKAFTDVVSYFTPEPGAGGGSIKYPLQGIEPGDHTLALTAWDNAGNPSTATLAFKVKADWRPSITSLSTDVNPATSSVRFLIDTDADDLRFCRIEVFDLSGKKVWSTDSDSSGSRSVGIDWDLVGSSGGRVARGIYIYRATVLTGDGTESSRTGRLAVAAG